MLLILHRMLAQQMDMNHMADHDHQMSMDMSMSMQSSINLVDPMNREGSGTSWVPDSTPMYGKMFMLGDDMLIEFGRLA